MRNSQSVGAKYIDGIQAPSNKGTRPIQVALQLDLATNVPVHSKDKIQKSASKPSLKRQNNPDKFYALATAALAGTRPPRKVRLQRYGFKKSNQLTIRKALKQAKLDTLGQPKVQIKSPEPAARKFSNTAARYLHTLRGYFARLFKHASRIVKFSGHRIILFQTAAIILLAGVLIITAINFTRYRTTMNNRLENERAQADAQWEDIQLQWKCINDTWSSIQGNQASTKQQGEVAC